MASDSPALSKFEAQAALDTEIGGLSPEKILWRRKWSILFITLLGGAIAWAYSASQTPAWEAQATLEVQETNQDFLNTRELNPVADSSRFGALTDIQTQIRILQSESLLDKAALSLGLGPSQNAPDERNAWLRKLEEQVQIRSPGVTRVIEIVVALDNPHTAADLANALSREYMNRNVASRSAETDKTNLLLNQQLADMLKNLEKSEEALQEHARKSGLLLTGDKQNIGDQKLREIEAELSKAEADRAAKQSHWEVEKNAKPDSLPELMDDREYRDVGFRLEDMKAQEAQLNATYQKGYRKNVQLHAAVVALEKAQVARRKAVLDRIHNEYLDAQGRERLLRVEYARQARIVQKDNENTVRYNLLKRDVEANSELYESLRLKVRQADFARVVPSGNVKVLDNARPPQKPVRPRTLVNLVAGLLSGLVFAVAFAVLRERTDSTLREQGAPAQLLGVPELGAVPHKGRKNARAVAQAWRGVATSVVFAGTDQATRRHAHSIYVITSASPGEGKTTVCCELAIALAETQLRILLVDADLCKPQVHERFAISGEPGLGALLQNPAITKEAIAAAIQQTTTPGLSILPGGAAAAAGNELLGSPSLDVVLRALRETYDIVLIDTPPVLLLPSARLAGRLAEGAILVIRAGSTPRKAALAACERLQSDGIPVATILNALAPEFAHPAYGYGKKA